LYNSRSTLGGLVSRLNYATKPGKTIELSFSMVLSDSQVFYGQVTSVLIQKPDSYLVAESNIHSIWFDHLGNVKKDLS
ncbi:hypothetical protein, partial [Vibrio parahaemolyticus]|uniref:hypothetical protein n=1 Tax=Vibrio parahaemolyticus TaxID=670 RepID=UPI001C929AD7